MSEDIEYFISRIQNQAGTNQIVVVLNDKCCKVEREDYFPDENGILTFHKKSNWRNEGYSVAEVLELIKKYSDRINDIRFEAFDGNVYPLVNVFESDSIGDDFEFNCFILVGDLEKVMKVYGNPENQNWMTDTLNIHKGFNY